MDATHIGHSLAASLHSWSQPHESTCGMLHLLRNGLDLSPHIGVRCPCARSFVRTTVPSTPPNAVEACFRATKSHAQTARKLSCGHHFVVRHILVAWPRFGDGSRNSRANGHESAGANCGGRLAVSCESDPSLTNTSLNSTVSYRNAVPLWETCAANTDTVDERNPAPPMKARNDDSPANINKQWFPIVSKWCRISSMNSIYHSPFMTIHDHVLTCPKDPEIKG